MATPEDASRLHVAIVGGGITGVTLALGLQARGIDYTIYERASGIKEIGAGIGFSPNAEVALTQIDPGVHAAYKRVATPNGEDYFQWVDGAGSGEVIYRLYLGENAFQGCRRSDFIEELAKMIPEKNVEFSKQAEAISQDPTGKVTLQFKDGTSTQTDIVLGCDGIRSNVRVSMFGRDNPASYAAYTNKFCFRGLVPMEEARKLLNPHRCSTRFMYNGPEAHSITYPVGQSDFLNVLLVISDPNPWETEDGRHTAVGDKSEATAAFAKWNPTAQALVNLLPGRLDKWAIFDMLEHPAPHYNQGAVCIAGDAAHAAGPHLGAGAGFGMEDALSLVTLCEAVQKNLAKLDGSGDVTRTKAALCRDALAAYNDVRYERTQWLIPRVREACDLFQWRFKDVEGNYEKFPEEITWRFHQIWEYDIDGMVKEGLDKLQERSASSLPV